MKTHTFQEIILKVIENGTEISAIKFQIMEKFSYTCYNDVPIGKKVIGHIEVPKHVSQMWFYAVTALGKLGWF